MLHVTQFAVTCTVEWLGELLKLPDYWVDVWRDQGKELTPRSIILKDFDLISRGRKLWGWMKNEILQCDDVGSAVRSQSRSHRNKRAPPYHRRHHFAVQWINCLVFFFAFIHCSKTGLSQVSTFLNKVTKKMIKNGNERQCSSKTCCSRYRNGINNWLTAPRSFVTWSEGRRRCQYGNSDFMHWEWADLQSQIKSQTSLATQNFCCETLIIAFLPWHCQSNTSNSFEEQNTQVHWGFDGVLRKNSGPEWSDVLTLLQGRK